MSQHAHLTVHRPGDIIIVMSEGGRVSAYQVERDGHLDPIDMAIAMSIVASEQKKQADQNQALFG